MEEFNILFIIFSLLFGACFGSFITMASHRLPLNEDIFFKKSYCPKCKKAIKVISLIPIFSWLFQGGKCLNCKAKISIRYPLTEIITSILFLFSYIKFGASFNTIIFDLMIVVCMIMIITDLEHYIIPDSMQICLLLLSIIFIYNNNLDIFYSTISGAVYFFIIAATGYIVEKWKKKEAIGGGDVKFITIVGMILGLNLLPTFLLLSGMIGVIFGLFWKKITKNEYFPFGPALIISFLSLMLYY